MTEHSRTHSPGSISPSEMHRIDQFCNQFEDRCKQGESPQLEEFVLQMPGTQQMILFKELLVLDLTYRRQNGDEPATDEYLTRFPQWAEIIQRVHGDCAEGDERTIEYKDLLAGASHDTGNKENTGTPDAASTSGGFGDSLTTFGNYTELIKLAQGGMGVVYKARQSGLGRLVALKMIRPGVCDSDEALRRFQVEAEAVARLQHPHIIQIYEVGAHDNQPFFSMEYVDGGSLAGQLDGTPWLTDKAAEFIRTLAIAMHEAHERQVVHRDLKPGNILLTETGEPKITDFGLAKQLDEAGAAITKTDAIMGTPCYMAPEQASGKTGKVGPAADIYALGVILYELLTGRPPFKGAGTLETLEQVRTQSPVPPRQLNPAVPKDVETICLKCLQKESPRRYETSQMLAEDLDRYLRREPILARPVSAFEKVLMWRKRNPWVAAMLSAIFLLLTTITVGALIASVIFLGQRDQLTGQRNILSKQNDDLTKNAFALKRAQKIEKEKTREALAGQAGALIAGGRSGRRLRSIKTLAEAAKIRPSLELRNAAISALALSDMVVVKQWPHEEGVLFRSVAFDPDLNWRAVGLNNGEISIRTLLDDLEIRRLPGFGRFVTSMQFSNTGRYLSVKYSRPNDFGFCIWDLERVEDMPLLAEKLPIFSKFVGNDTVIALGAPNVRYIALPSLKPVASAKYPKKTRQFAYCPDSRRVAIRFEERLPILTSRPPYSGIEIWDWKQNKRLRRLHPGREDVLSLAWSPDGKYLAGGTLTPDTVWFDVKDHHITSEVSQPSIWIWDTASAGPPVVWKNLNSTARTLAFHPSGRYLLSGGSSTAVWEFGRGEEILRVPGTLLRFNSDGTQLAFRTQNGHGIWQLALSDEFRRLAGKEWRPHERRTRWLELSPDGRLLCCCEDQGFSIWDVETSDRVAALRAPRTYSAYFDRLDGSLITNSSKGIFRWPLKEIGKNGLGIGPPASINTASPETSGVGMVIGDRPARLVLASEDGGVKLEVFENRSKALVTQRRTGTRKIIDFPIGIQSVELSPNGKWFASNSPSKNREMLVWDADAGKVINRLASGGSRQSFRFSRDSKWMVICTTSATEFWETGSWKKKFTRKFTGRISDLSPDGKYFATVEGATIQLYNVKSGEIVAGFATLPATQILFSPDGTRLLSAHNGKGIHVWDLRRLRKQLAANGLDWNLPPFAETTENESRHNLAAQVDLGEFGGFFHRNAANRLIRQSNWQGALNEANLAVKNGPEVAANHQVRGEAHLGLGLLKQATVDFEAFLKFKPGETRDYFVCAWKLATRKELPSGAAKQALSWSQTAVRKHLANTTYRLTLGIAQFRSGLYKKAAGTLQLASYQSLFSKGDDALFCNIMLSMCYAKMDAADMTGKNLQKARTQLLKNRATLKRLRTGNPDLHRLQQEAAHVVAERYYQRGLTRSRTGKLSDAIQEFSGAINLGWRTADVFHFRGHTWEKMKRFADALKDFEEAARLAPKNDHLFDEIALLRCNGPKEIRDPRAAFAAVQKAMLLRQNSTTNMATLGFVYYRRGQIDNALQTLLRVNDNALRDDRQVLKYLFLSMCYHKKGDPKRARRAFDQASGRWKLLLGPGVMIQDMYQRTRQEAEAMLDSGKSSQPKTWLPERCTSSKLPARSSIHSCNCKMPRETNSRKTMTST